ncbi:M28 family metallopeptidase [Litoribacillus peritrichatus]|uniref:Aminopeptidase PaaP n=1 Tax=Litoribacillus peritrichatus TaxID=718191 RepID=A0ABP7N2N2_9GAMM
MLNGTMNSTLLGSALAALITTGLSTPLMAEEASINPEVLNKFWSPDRLFPFECSYGLLNNSPWGIPRCMQADNVMAKLRMLNDIANANDGTRAAGLPGYQASIDYVKSELEQAGYEVTLQSFPFSVFYPQGPGTLELIAQDSSSYEWEVDFGYLSQTDAGDVTGPVAAVDLALGEGNASTSGCEATDFTDFPAGAIALIQRGACAFQVKAENAAAAGASGVVIFNQGNSDDRKGLLSATLGDDYSGGIPVLFATYDLGVEWSQLAGLELHMITDVIREQSETLNVIAETRFGAEDNIIMAGAHLDSVFEGAGINDNGSGSAALLELAIQMRNTFPNNKVRFAWWGAEEAGLVGSTHYVENLAEDEKAKIKAYLNFDMIGSPNYTYAIYDGDGSDFDLEGPAGSAAIETMFESYYTMRGLPFEGSEISFRSDYAQFFLEEIPFGGLFSGAEGLKTEAQAETFGGEANVAYDPCYHQSCDDIMNMSETALEINIDAVAFVTTSLAQSTQVIDDEKMADKKPEALSLRSFSSASKYDMTHWGKHWIK